MNPRSVAVIGASQRTDALPNREPRGNRVIRNLKNFGYPGRIVAINPKYSRSHGLPLLSGYGAIPEPVDCVVLAVPNRHVPDLLESAADAGVLAPRWYSPPDSPRPGLRAKARQARLEALVARARISHLRAQLLRRIECIRQGAVIRLQPFLPAFLPARSRWFPKAAV